MPPRRSRTTTPRLRRRRIRAAALAAALVAVAAAAAGDEMPIPSTSTAASPIAVPRSEHRGPPGRLAVSNLDPGLLQALRAAKRAAAAEGVEIVVDSGWRSPEHQQRLLEEAISKYGSAEEAARWVATPERSAHVSGDAIDVEPDAAAWLAPHGARFGLCQIYENEPWHYELRADAADHGCPPKYPDPTHDPRMQR